MRITTNILLLLIFLFSCNYQKQEDKRIPNLLADREAPLGWIYLRTYTDSSFEFVSSGLRTKTIYSGKYHLFGDTIYFDYKDSTPKAGTKALLTKNHVVYLDGGYKERIEIKLNTLRMNKKFKSVEIKKLIPAYGYCIATDKITVDGLNVGYMYREEPDKDTDSGWRILSGTESQEYLDNPNNSAIYDLNTIANYDTTIIPFLDMPIGTELERIPNTNKFKRIEK